MLSCLLSTCKIAWLQSQRLLEKKGIVQQMQPLLNNVEGFWTRTVTPQTFSVFNLPRRTNNALQSFHSKILGIMGPHTNIWRFVVFLFELLMYFQLEYCALLGGNQRRHWRYCQGTKNTETIRRCMGMLVRRDYSLVGFLRRASHTLHSIFNVFIRQNVIAEELAVEIELEEDSEEEGLQESLAARQARGAPQRPPRTKADETAAAETCRVCLIQRKTHVVYPCAHFAVCGTCVGILVEQAEGNGELRCPMCRGRAGGITRVFFLVL
ncbi:hypothetical protein PR048_012680 [Dryococelus australis]|uniref:RING-type domain-containing protein n=1 Tax=Dryococelus australis TaxID=614101 RepID=A0ABQ9HQ16_9NEOP|nr:hypothetical protein PR048_012680 [Dryococelus australis]